MFLSWLLGNVSSRSLRLDQCARRRFRPAVEALGDRRLLSASPLAPLALDLGPALETQQADPVCEQSFQGNGSYVDTSGKTNTTAGTLSGATETWGSYTGDYWHKKRENLTLADGRGTLYFEGGSLTFDYVIRLVPGSTTRYEGTFVITKGTGLFKGASGGGTMVVEQTVLHEGISWFDGVVCI